MEIPSFFQKKKIEVAALVMCSYCGFLYRKYPLNIC